MTARILIVEDTPNNLMLMAYLLESAGHHIMKATSASEGLVLARAEKPELIVMDIQMPGMDGYQALAEIRSDQQMRDTVVLAVTAYAMVGNRDQVLAAGFDGYLAKPIDPETFVADIETLLPTSSAKRPEAHTSLADRPDVESRGTGETVLLVDDLDTNVTLLRSILSVLDLRVLEASSVGEALTIVNDERPALVLSDMHIGRERGIDLLRCLEESGQLSELTFAFVTATWAGNEALFDEWGIEVIRRPIEPGDLVERVKALLDSDPRDRS